MPPYGEEVAEPSYVQKRNIREQTEVTTSQTDKDQVVKYDAIIELLLAAGYFRARIPALSPFDKVIGGLTWCITSSQVRYSRPAMLRLSLSHFSVSHSLS